MGHSLGIHIESCIYLGHVIVTYNLVLSLNYLETNVCKIIFFLHKRSDDKPFEGIWFRNFA